MYTFKLGFISFVFRISKPVSKNSLTHATCRSCFYLLQYLSLLLLFSLHFSAAILPEAAPSIGFLHPRDGLQYWALSGAPQLYGPLSQARADSCSSPSFLLVDVQLDALRDNFCSYSSTLAGSCVQA